MRKIVLVLIVLLLAAPSWAAVSVNCTAVNPGTTYEVRVDYSADSNNIRAFGIRIDVNNGATININDVNDVNDKDYYIFPGSIDINDTTGEVDANGTAVAEGGNGQSYMILEMGSLYAASDPKHQTAPASSGTICTFETSKECVVSLSRDTDRGGVVMEDGSDYASLSGCAVAYAGCLPQVHADWTEWDSVGRPDCWCYPRQCYGDADGKTYGNPLTGYAYVDSPDLLIMADAWQIKDPPDGPGISGNQICADISHSTYGNPLTGYARVDTDDLIILATYWQIKEPPDGPGIPSDCGGTLTPP